MGTIWYHGTLKEKADAILASGFFKAGTFFAANMESALHYGGDHIFEVFFPESPSDYWEWVCPEPVPVKGRVVLLFRVDPEVLYHDPAVEMEACQPSLLEHPLGTRICEVCQGKGQLETLPPFSRWRGSRCTCTPCKVCEGYGVIPRPYESAVGSILPE